MNIGNLPVHQLNEDTNRPGIATHGGGSTAGQGVTVASVQIPAGLTVLPAKGSALTAAPAMLVLPCGGYLKHADHEAEPIAEWLASMGIHAIVLRYRVAPHRYPAALEDAKRSILWIKRGRHGLNVDTRRVGVIGFSAGGHLAAMLATGTACGSPAADDPDSIPELSILGYPVISFVNDAHRGSLTSLAGHDPAPVALQQLSAERRVTESTPPTFIWHTADDTVVPVSHSLSYAKALDSAGIATQMHIFPHGAHGLGLAAHAPGASQWTGLCANWLTQQGWT